jgi:hypothetical protein
MKKIVEVTDNRKTYAVIVGLFIYLGYITVTSEPMRNEIVVGFFGLIAAAMRAGIGKNGTKPAA